VPGYVVHQNAAMTCMHGGAVSVAPVQTRVLVSALAVATVPSQLTVAGCVFTLPNGTPHPCVLVKWANPASRVTVMGQPALLQAPPTGSGNGVCQAADQAPQGVPNVATVQQRVIAT
jgi:hypothetical protein